MSEPGEGVTANRTLRERSHAKQLPSRTRSKKSKKRVAIIRVSNRTRSHLDSRKKRRNLGFAHVPNLGGSHVDGP